MGEVKIIIEYLLKSTYHHNLVIANEIIWFKYDDIEYFDHVIDIEWYVYRINGIKYTEDSPAFQQAVEQYRMWEMLQQ